MFWFKRKKIIIDCFTTDPFAYEYTKISPASQYVPEWWKKLPLQNKDKQEYVSGTMKHCRGFTNLFGNSFVIPFWGFAEIDVSDDSTKLFEWNSNYNFVEDKLDSVIVHPSKQYEGFVDSNKFFHIKITSPWFLKSKDSVEFMVHDPLWNRSDLTSYSVLPGVLDFKYQHSTNVNLMIEFKQQSRKINFSHSDVVCMLTPLSEREVVLNHHLIDKGDLRKINHASRFYNIGKPGLYNDIKKFMDKHEERNKSKCPFGFGK